MYYARHGQGARHGKAIKHGRALKKGTIVGIAVAGAGLAVLAGPHAAKADTVQNTKTAQQVYAAAKATVRGEYGSGSARVAKLTAAGYNAAQIQALVNEYFQQGKLTMPQAAVAVATKAAPVTQTPATAATPAAPAETQAPAATSAASTASTATDSTTVTAADQAVINSFGYVSAQTMNTVVYAAQKISAATGVSVSQWESVIMRESSGNPAALNPSSGTYGLFQLNPIHQGVYVGMSVDEQIALATKIYEMQGPNAWIETW